MCGPTRQVCTGFVQQPCSSFVCTPSCLAGARIYLQPIVNFAFRERRIRRILPHMASAPDTPPIDVNAHLADMASELSQEFKISPELSKLIERGIHSTKLPAPLRKVRAAEAMQQAFELIGGVPRLALWADANPDKFYQLYGRMIPQTIAPVLPDDGPKDNVIELPWVTARRLLYKEAQQIAQDIEAKGELTPALPAPKQSDGS